MHAYIISKRFQNFTHDSYQSSYHNHLNDDTYTIRNGLGYAKILVIVAFFRELLGSGTLLGFNILNYEPIQNTGYINNGFMLMPPMALIIVACIIWYQRARHKELQEESN